MDADTSDASVVIRPYLDDDEQAWMRVHAVILSISRAWNYSIQERPVYAGHESTRLVATINDTIVGLTDAQYETEAGEFCFLKDSPGGYVLEFGRLPEYNGLRIGEKLVEATIEDAKSKGIRRLEYWSQDRGAQRFYAKRGMPEIGRHYRFRFRPTRQLDEIMLADRVGIEYVYAMCLPEDWPTVKAKYQPLTDHPLEPRLNIGYEIRF